MGTFAIPIHDRKTDKVTRSIPLEGNEYVKYNYTTQQRDLINAAISLRVENPIIPGEINAMIRAANRREIATALYVQNGGVNSAWAVEKADMLLDTLAKKEDADAD